MQWVLKLRGAGTGTIRIEGVDKLYGAEHLLFLTVLKQVHLWLQQQLQVECAC